jgi:hypothetical protein
MYENIGNIDRIIRVFISLAIIIPGIICRADWGAIGIIPLVTAISAICPVYLILRVTTLYYDEEVPVKG